MDFKIVLNEASITTGTFFEDKKNREINLFEIKSNLKNFDSKFESKFISKGHNEN
jgi:hypothetical protein